MRKVDLSPGRGSTHDMGRLVVCGVFDVAVGAFVSPLLRERSVKRSVPLDPPVVTQDCTDEVERLRAENERLREQGRVSPTARYLVRVFLGIFGFFFLVIAMAGFLSIRN